MRCLVFCLVELLLSVWKIVGMTKGLCVFVIITKHSLESSICLAGNRSKINYE